MAAQADTAREDLSEVQERFDALEEEVRGTAREMLENEETAISWARDLYMGGTMDALEVLLSSKSLSDVDAQLTYLQFSSDRQRRIFEDLRVRRQELDIQLESLAEAHAVPTRLQNGSQTCRRTSKRGRPIASRGCLPLLRAGR